MAGDPAVVALSVASVVAVEPARRRPARPG